MPEGPEIRRAADELAASLTGKSIERIYFAFDELKKYESDLCEQKITHINSRGKAILTQLDNGLTIYSHNQLYGLWRVLSNGPYPESTRQLRLAIHTHDTMALLYSASDISVLNKHELEAHHYLTKLGPELLDHEMTLETLQKRFADRSFQRRALMGLLQDQHFIAGMGNYLCCEALHLSKIWPEKRLVDLTAEQSHRLIENCLYLTRQSYKTAGTTNLSKRIKQLQNEGKTFEEYRFMIYRRAGEQCYHCGTKL